MRFLVDAQLPPALADWLRTKGYDAEHVFDRLGGDSPDTLIAQASVAAGYIVISKDGDFLQLQVDGRPQVICVKLGNTTNRRLLEAFEAEWTRIHAALAAGEPVVEIG